MSAKNETSVLQLNRGLPFHAEAEQCVLGSVLMDPTFAIPHTLGYLSVEDFYIPAHKAIFNAMLKTHRSHMPLDIVLLVKELEINPVIQDVGGSSYLGLLTEQTPTAANVKYYARILKADSDRRLRIIKATDEIQDAYSERRDLPKGYVKLADVLETVLENAYVSTTAGRYNGYATGFDTLDEYLGGLQQGELYIVAGRPSQGKSALCTQMANHIYSLGGRIAFFPLENGFRGQARNIASMSTRTEGWKLRAGKGSHQTPEETDALIAYLQLQRQGVFNMSLARSPQAVEVALREMISEHGGLDVIFIDHLQEMLPDEKDKWAKRHYQIETILQSIREIGREFLIPVVLAAQIGRAAEGREPTIAEIKDSGSIEQIADVVMIIHGENRGTGARTLNVAKNRNGATGKLNLHLQGEYLRFEEREG